MNLLNRIRSFFGRDDGPRTLRNKPGGMAWITARMDEGDGGGVIVGMAVKTVALDEHGLWLVEPPPRYRTTARSRCTHTGQVVPAGALCTVVSIADSSLEPWKEDGITKEEVRELYEPQKQGVTA